jgi:hypothetical protein
VLGEIRHGDVVHPEPGCDLDLLRTDVDSFGRSTAALLQPPHETSRAAANVENHGTTVRGYRSGPAGVVHAPAQSELLERGLALSADEMGTVVGVIEPRLIVARRHGLIGHAAGFSLTTKATASTGITPEGLA